MCRLIVFLTDADMCPMTQFGSILMCDLDPFGLRVNVLVSGNSKGVIFYITSIHVLTLIPMMTDI